MNVYEVLYEERGRLRRCRIVVSPAGRTTSELKRLMSWTIRKMRGRRVKVIDFTLLSSDPY